MSEAELEPHVERMSAGRRAWLDVVHAWPVILTILALVAALITTVGTARVRQIADEQITAAGKNPSAQVTVLETQMLLTNQSVTTNAGAIERVESGVIRVEGKLDALLLLMQQRQAP